jgi:membrane associated rhomboid family serine protease
MTSTSVGMRCPECSRERTQVRTISSLASEPYVTYALMAACVVVWLAELATGSGREGGGEVFARGALFGPSIEFDHEYWRLVTGGFLHANDMPFGIVHIGFNMYLLYVLGGMLEPSIGRLRFAAIYFTALLAGSFGALLLTPDSPTVGASGAVFGLMGAAVVVMRARGIDPWQSGIGPLIVLNLLLTFTLANISIGGHIGGLVGGAAAAYLLVDRPPAWRLPGALACAALAAASVAGGIAAAGGAGVG